MLDEYPILLHATEQPPEPIKHPIPPIPSQDSGGIVVVGIVVVVDCGIQFGS